ncbi:hypothetical protein H5410_043509 [Solanum commersonii]|uniref:Cytochrome P450 n=1 Tax=Solanum commersonii TaxID=4109 RepID=A0A9J5XXC8_SOLCO|nr:hypothetical protein H5410_043509 [Solanum commersonii]
MSLKFFKPLFDSFSCSWQESNIEQKGVFYSYVLGIVALLWFLWLFINKSKKGLPPLPPGPKALPLLGNLHSLDPELHTYFASLSQTYGSICRLWLGKKLGIIITSPALAREVLKDQDTIFANRDVPAAGREATYGGTDIVWTPYGPKWRMLRKVCVREMLSGSTLDSVYALRRRELRQTINYFYSQAGLPVNIGEQMFLTVFNVITSMLWGGTVKGEERASLGAEFRHVVTKMTELLGTPNLSDFYPGLARFDLQGVAKKMKVLAKRFDKIFESMIDKRHEIDTNGGMETSVGQENKDFLQVLLKLKDDEAAKMPLTMPELKALLMDMVVGGTDTTSNTVEFAMAEIMNKPDVLRKLQQEIDTVVGEDNIVEESHIQHLPYLYAVMKEVLRLHPALPLLVPHCPSETSTVGGYIVPKGSRVFINVWAIQRDPSIWENPTEFHPERFSGNKWDYSGNDLNYFPFGSGRRICAGIAMAERMFMYSLASLIHSFDWKLPEGETLDLTEKFGIVLKKKMPLVAIPTPRLSNPTLYDNSNKGLPPGPKPLPLIGNLLSLDPQLHTYFASLSQTYGPICRLWLGKKLGIIITSPALASEVLKDQDTIFANRDVSVAGREVTYGGTDIVWTPYGPKWRMLMKAGSPVNIGEQMFLTALNVITSMLWGGTVKGEERASLGAEVRDVVTKMNELLVTPNLSDFYPGLAWFDLQGVKKKMKVLAKRYDNIFGSMIDQRQQMNRNGVGQESKDFLQVLLKLKDEADPKMPLTMTEIKALLTDMVVGGTETSTNTVEFAMTEIMNKPDVLRKLQQELDTIVGKDNIMEVSHIQHETVTVGGYTVPKGSSVFINVWAIHRDPSIWENPTAFHPERFMENKWDFSGNDLTYFPFGSGRRICVGLAMAERMFMTDKLYYGFFVFSSTSQKKGQPPLPPGPKALPLLGNLHSLDPQLHTYFASLSQTYGPICRLWLGKKLGLLLLHLPACKVLKNQDTIFANRDVPAACKESSYGGKDIVWTPYGPNGAGSPVNIGEQMFLTALNVITSMLWGGTVKGGERSRLGAEFRHVVADMTELLGTPNISDFYPGLARFDLQGVTKKMNVLEKRFESMIDQRQKIDRNAEMGTVMKEALRIHPTLPLLVPHCPSETCTVGGYTVPKGSRVFINVWTIQRDPSIWKNPTEFHPERFLDSKWDYSGNDFNYFPFGSGRRTCAGRVMAERMFMYSLASLIYSFDWKLSEGKTLDLTEKFGIVLKKKIPLVAIPTPRLSNPKLNSNKRLPPGPKAFPLIGNLHTLDPELHTYFASLSQTYGPICRLWLGKKLGIIITSPALAREVLKDKDTIFANRDVPAAGSEFSYGGNNVLWTPYGPKWRMLRKVCVRDMLNSSTLDSVYALRRRELRQSINYFYSKKGLPVNVGEQMFLTILNVITSMLWGGTVKGEERASLGAEFRLVVTEIAQLVSIPNLSDFYPGLAWFDFQGVIKKMKLLAKRFDKIFESMIDQRQKLDRNGVVQESKDFLQVLLKLKDEADPEMPLTMTEIKALLMEMVLGGTDTSVNTIEFAMAEIMHKPDVLRKLQQEVDTAVGKDNIVEESHIQQLPYLYAVMKEVLRLHPAAPLLIPHCPSETCTVGGYTVPKGSCIFINVWAIQRDASIWKNPTEFRPERFLDNKWDYSGKDLNYFPFGSGRRICAGIGMAERMFMYSLASLIHSFDWKLPKGVTSDVTEMFGITLRKKIPLVAIPTPRLSNPTLYE